MSKPTAQERQVLVANFDKQIAEMRLAQVRRDKAKAEFQANWYEHAPLSWLLRKTAHAFDRAVTTRLTGVAKEQPVYDAHYHVAAMPGEPTSKELKTLSRSYQNSVHVAMVGPAGKKKAVLHVLWVCYRAVRKAGKFAAKILKGARS